MGKYCGFLDEPEFWVHFNGWLTVAWFTQFPLVLAIVQDLQDSVRYLVIISIAAAALGQLAAWQAARVELKLKRFQKETRENQ
jgi:hypothetical protein